MIFIFSALCSDEIRRMEAIVDDIAALRKQHEKCTAELSGRDSLAKENELLKQRVYELEKTVNSQQKLLKTKEIGRKNNINTVFPQLMMKGEESVFFEASAFRLNKESYIYDGAKANVIDKWEEGTSFTSNMKIGSWIKITGYFIDRKWTKAQEDMWVRSEDAIKRH